MNTNCTLGFTQSQETQKTIEIAPMLVFQTKETIKILLTLSVPVKLLNSPNLSPNFSSNTFEKILLLILSSLPCLINSQFLITKCLIFYVLCKEKFAIDIWLGLRGLRVHQHGRHDVRWKPAIYQGSGSRCCENNFTSIHVILLEQTISHKKKQTIVETTEHKETSYVK